MPRLPPSHGFAGRSKWSTIGPSTGGRYVTVPSSEGAARAGEAATTVTSRSTVATATTQTTRRRGTEPPQSATATEGEGPAPRAGRGGGPGQARGRADGPGWRPGSDRFALGRRQPRPQLEDGLGVDLAHPALGDPEDAA